MYIKIDRQWDCPTCGILWDVICHVQSSESRTFWGDLPSSRHHVIITCSNSQVLVKSCSNRFPPFESPKTFHLWFALALGPGLKDVEEHEELVCELLGWGLMDGRFQANMATVSYGKSHFWRGELKSDSGNSWQAAGLQYILHIKIIPLYQRTEYIDTSSIHRVPAFLYLVGMILMNWESPSDRTSI